MGKERATEGRVVSACDLKWEMRKNWTLTGEGEKDKYRKKEERKIKIGMSEKVTRIRLLAAYLKVPIMPVSQNIHIYKYICIHHIHFK